MEIIKESQKENKMDENFFQKRTMTNWKKFSDNHCTGSWPASCSVM